MMRKAMAVLLAAVMLAGVLSGCGKSDAPAQAGEMTDSSTQQGGTDRPQVQQMLTGSRSVFGGPESNLLKDFAQNFVPTGRLTGPDGYVRATQRMVFPGEGGETETGVLVFAYDGEGRQLSSGNQRADGVEEYEWFTYDEEGRLLIHQDRSGKEILRYSYDSEGRCQVIDRYDTRYDDNGVWSGQTVFTYEGNQVTESWYPKGSDTPESYTVYTDGRITEYREKGKYVSQWERYEYDGHGNLCRITTVSDGEEEIVYEMRYDERGVLTAMVEHSSYYSGDVRRYFYNEAGDCILIESGYTDSSTGEWDWDLRLDFLYDEWGNLLAEQCADDSGDLVSGYYMRYTYDRLP